MQASAQAYLSFGKKKRKGKDKGKSKFPVRSSRLPLGDRRQQLKALRERTECYACGRKRHWAHGCECTVSPFSLFPNTQTRTARMTTRQHLSGQSRKATTCFVLDDCDDDSEIFANMVDGKVSLSLEQTKRTSPTPIALNAVDTGERNTPNIPTAYDDDGPQSGGDKHKSDQNTRFKNDTHRSTLSGDVLRDYQKLFMSLTKAGNASTDMCEFLF